MAHNQDWREWLESLNASGVEYVVVGGIALAFHGIVRYTGDLYVLVHASAANAAANAVLREALEALGCSPIRALGADPNSDHAEESWCVTGLTDTQARQIGAKFGQWAVFRISMSEQVVLGCFGEWSRSRGL
jgi:hypothetical protein